MSGHRDQAAANAQPVEQLELVPSLRAYGPTGEWREINEAIIERWSVSALVYIKEKAWKLAA